MFSAGECFRFSLIEYSVEEDCFSITLDTETIILISVYLGGVSHTSFNNYFPDRKIVFPEIVLEAFNI